MDHDEKMQAYYGCPAFKAALEAKAIWEEAHALYRENPSDATRERLNDAYDFWQSHMDMARATPEHKAAFGW